MRASTASALGLRAEPIIAASDRGGLSVPLPALQLLLSLEARGLDIHTDGEQLVVGPKDAITADDDRAIRAHRDALYLLTSYVEHEVSQ